MGGVFDHGQVVPPGDFQDGLHLARVPAVMHDHDGFGAAGDVFFDFPGSDGQIIQALDVGKAHLGAGIEHGIGGRHERQRGQDHFIARADSQGQAGQVQGMGAV